MTAGKQTLGVPQWALVSGLADRWLGSPENVARTALRALQMAEGMIDAPDADARAQAFQNAERIVANELRFRGWIASQKGSSWFIAHRSRRAVSTENLAAALTKWLDRHAPKDEK